MVLEPHWAAKTLADGVPAKEVVLNIERAEASRVCAHSRTVIRTERLKMHGCRRIALNP
jgi:Zn finger protein HypA/HybF involved in hydrogenase expression